MVVPMFREKIALWYDGTVDHNPEFKSGGTIQRLILKRLSGFLLAPEMLKTGLRTIRSVSSFDIRNSHTQSAFALLQLSTDMRGMEQLRSFVNRDKWTVNAILTLPAAMTSITTADHRLLGSQDTFISSTNGVFAQALAKYGFLDNTRNNLSVSFPWLLHVLRPLLLTHHRALATSTLAPLSPLIVQLLREEIELEQDDRNSFTRQQKHEAAIRLQELLLMTGLVHNDTYNNNIQHLQSFLHRIDLIPATSLGDFSFESIPSNHSFQRVTTRTKRNMALHTLPPDFYSENESAPRGSTSKQKKKRARSSDSVGQEVEGEGEESFKLADLGPFLSSRPEYSSRYSSHTGPGDEEMLLSRVSRKRLRLGHLLTQSATLDKQRKVHPHQSNRHGISMRTNITSSSSRLYHHHTGDRLASTARDMAQLYQAHPLPTKRMRLGESHLPNTPMTIMDYLDPYDGMRMDDAMDSGNYDECEMQQEKELATHIRSIAADKLLQSTSSNKNKRQRLEQQFDNTADHALAVVMQELAAETMRRWYRSGSSAPLAFALETVLPLSSCHDSMQGSSDNDTAAVHHEKMVKSIATSTARAQVSMNSATSLLSPEKKLLQSRMHMLLGSEFRPRNMYAHQVKDATTSALSENSSKSYGHLGMMLNHHATRVSAFQEQQNVILEPEKGLTSSAVFEGAVKSRYAPKRNDMNKLPTYIRENTKPQLPRRTSTAGSVSSGKLSKKRKRDDDDEENNEDNASDSIEFESVKGDARNDEDEDDELDEERRRYSTFLTSPQRAEMRAVIESTLL